MRIDKELIQLMLDNLDEYFCISLCLTTPMLYARGIISGDEEIKIDSIVFDNRPNKKQGGGYFWPKYELEPRREFLQNILNKLS